MSKQGKDRTQPTGNAGGYNHGVKNIGSVGNKYGFKPAPAPKLPSKPRESGNKREK